MQKIRIDFDNPGLPQHISAVENDSQSRFFQATLYENGKAYTAPEGATYSIMYRGFGPQNQGWYDTINDGAGKRAACAVSGNVVTCEIARQALQVPGHVSIVLCVTTGKGYMLKSWPIECDCKNDRYDSTVEIQSFFYVTQVSNADWNRILQALEDLKNTIDPTLSVSGKAADAAKVGEAIGKVEEDLAFSFDAEKVASVNLYNAETATKKCYLNPNTGVATVKDSYDFVTSDYIEIQPNSTYTAVSIADKSNTTAITACFYADDKSFISNAQLRPTGTVSAVSPNTAKYARISSSTNVMTNIQLMLIHGTDVPSEYSPYTSPKTNYVLKNESVSEKNTTFISVTQSKNIIGTEFGKNMVRTDNGNLYPNEQYTNTDYIPVVTGHVYVLSQYGVASKLEKYALYTDTKAYIQNSGKDNDSNAYITIPDGAFFIRISRGNYVDLSDGFQFEEVSSVNDNPTFYQKSGEIKQFEQALLNRLVDYSSLKWDCLGDSFTDGSPRYHTYISARTGIKVKNDGLAGSAVAKYTAGQSTLTFLERLENLDLSSNIISIFGGINDARAILSNESRLGTIDDKPNSIEEANTFYGAYRYLIEYLKNNAPKAIIFAIVPPKLHAATGGDYENADRYIPKVRQAILDLCEEYSVPIVDLYSESGISKMSIDVSTWYRGNKDIHLNDKGQNKISTLIESKLKQLIN
nr:MAG TPA: hydrolase [Caudoviricetes sp.]